MDIKLSLNLEIDMSIIPTWYDQNGSLSIIAKSDQCWAVWGGLISKFIYFNARDVLNLPVKFKSSKSS